MKTLRDTNNNNSNNTNNHLNESYFSSNLSSITNHHHHLPVNGLLHQRQNSNIDAVSYPSLLTLNNLPSATYSCANNDLSSTTLNIGQSGDLNQLSSIIQTYLSKIGNNSNFQADSINPLIYFQLLNANALFMQQLNANLLSNSNSLIDSSTENIHSGRKSQIIAGDSSIYVPQTRPMSQNEIAEHARLVYQRALHRNQFQQHNDLMKHFYETRNIKQQHISSHTIHPFQQSINQNNVPSVPHVSNIASIGSFDVLDTMITSGSSNLSMKETNINGATSSFSLLSLDDSKLNSSVLDPSAPVFIPRQNRQKFDDENETLSSSSDSDFNDFHYLDQFLDEFYNSNNRYDNHLIISKLSSSNSKYSIHSHVLGQGDTIEQKIDQTNDSMIEQSSTKSQCQYSIYQLLDRYRNPRCHLVLPEWSRLSLILPNVCSMRAHTYKIKRYFAYRRRLSEDPNLENISIQN